MFLTQTAHLVFDALLSLAYPQPCKICGLSVESYSFGIACEACWKATRIFSGCETVCWKCGVPSGGYVPENLRGPIRCHRCDSHQYEAARAAGIYETALRESVLLLKRRPHLCTHLVGLLTAAGKRPPLNGSTRIVPVPLHRERARERGFNQALVIGRILSRTLELPLDGTSLVRVASSDKYRAGLDARGREETVAGAFQVQYPRLVAGEAVLLVDDVFTTGATASSCAEALLAAGARSVFVLTVARPSW